MNPLTDQEIEQLRTEGYREGDTVPGRGVLTPDGTFRNDTTNISRAINAPTPTDYDTALTGEIARQKGLANQSLDENKVRRDTLRMFQTEIDAVNRIYADKLAEERLAGQGRLGSTYAIGARRGLLGSDFGTAQAEETTKYNKQLTSAIRNEQSAKIAEIMGKARKESSDEIAAKRKAIQEGATSYLDYLGKSEDRKTSKISKLVASLLAEGIDPSTEPDQIKEIAKTLGVSESDILNQYSVDKREYDIAQEESEAKKEKAKLDAEKVALDKLKIGVDISKPYESGGYLWQYNSSTGAIENIGNARSVNDGTTDEDVSANQLKQFINTQIATAEFKALTEDQKKDFIRANGGTPSDYEY